MSDLNGAYYFEFNEDAVFVEPAKNDDTELNLSNLDMLRILRFIYGLERLTSPYHLIAADVTNDRVVNLRDVSELNNIISGSQDRFINNSSWRYITEHDIINISNVYDYLAPMNIKSQPYNDLDMINFIGIKIGNLVDSRMSQGYVEMLNGSMNNAALVRFLLEIDELKMDCIHPNPVSDILHIAPIYQHGSYRLLDSQGRLLMETQDIYIKVDGLSNGIYFLQFVDDTGGLIETKTFVKN